MRHFEYTDTVSAKFWQVEQEQANLNIRWGRIGTQGQSQTKSFENAAKASAAMLKLVTEKTGKGYKEVVLDGAAKLTEAQNVVAIEEHSLRPRSNKKIEATVPNVSEPPGTHGISEEPQVESTARTETVDHEVERAMIDICTQMSNGNLSAPQGGFTIAKIRQMQGISEVAAIEVSRLLIKCGLNTFWSGAFADRGKMMAARHLAELSEFATKSQVIPSTTDVDVPTAPTRATLPPWLRNGEPLYLGASAKVEMHKRALPSRRFPKAIGAVNVQEAWSQLRAAILKDTDFDIAASEPALRDVFQNTCQFLGSPDLSGTMETDTILMALTCHKQGYFHKGCGELFVNYLVTRHGIKYVVETLIAAEKIEVVQRDERRQRILSLHTKVTTLMNTFGNVCDGELAVRAHLAVAPQVEYEACVAKIRAALADVPAVRRPMLALLLPDVPEITHELIRALCAEDVEAPHSVNCLQLTATDPVAIELASKVKSVGCFWIWQDAVSTILLEHGVHATQWLGASAMHDAPGDALTCIGTPEAVAALARVASSSKHALARLHLVVKRWPAAAMFALTRLLSSQSKDQSLLKPTLIQLLREHPELPDQLRPWMEPACLMLIDQMLARLAGPAELAETLDLPEVLAKVPWLQTKKKLSPSLQLGPVPIAAVEQWDAGKREQMIRTASNTTAWYWERLQRAEADPEHMITEICLFRDQALPKHMLERQRASTAIKNGNLAEFIEAMRAIISVMKKDDPKLSYYSYFDALPFSRLPPALGIPCWNAIAGEFPWTRMDAIAAAWGLAALPGLAVNISKEPSNYIDLSQYFGAVELAPVAARVFAKLKTIRGWGRNWLLKFPEHAIAGLIPPALGKPGEARDNAALALRWLARNGHAKLLDQVAARYEQAEVITALHTMLNENPLERYPNKRAALPGFWNPSGWCRPLLHNGKALSDEALDVLGTMMTFPTNEEVYVGLHQVKTACTQQSLADFAWDCFSAWLNAGAPAKEAWALTSLGVLGNDEVARKLTPYIRAWPGEGAHARAVTALDVLANIGTDVALMLLNGIAKKIKYKPLQEKAIKKIQDIAETRGLTSEELEDRLAPDLGLNEQGSLVLNFGPRAFQVGFDESLKPYVREWVDNKAGARLPDLPKPKQTDNEAHRKRSQRALQILEKGCPHDR